MPPSPTSTCDAKPGSGGEGEGDACQKTKAKSSPFPAVPVTLLSGFLGAGKTTLLKNILEQKEGLQVAVLVNDMAELNIDASLVKKEHLLKKEEQVVEMQNGCICCTLRQDLLVEMTRLAVARRFDAVIIESTGVSEPQQVAETFTFPIAMADEDEEGGDGEAAASAAENGEGEEGKLNPVYQAMKEARDKLGGGEEYPESLNELARLDTCVTVVDCRAFNGDLATCESLVEKYKDRGQGVEDEDDRDVAQLLIDQIEFANVILVNKTDLVSEEEAGRVEKAIKVLNPAAKVIRTVRSKVNFSEVMNTGLFDMDEAYGSPGWLRSMQEELKPETEEYGIGSFVYRSRTPFHPGRFARFTKSIFVVTVTFDEEQEGEPEEGEGVVARSQEERDERNEECAKRLKNMRENYGQILRSKGFVWLAGRDMQYGEWSQAGAVATLDCGGLWLSCLPEELQPRDSEAFVKDLEGGGPVVQDRRQELVIIGSDLQREKLTEALDACLLKEEENKRPEGGEENKSPEAWKMGFAASCEDDDPIPKWPDAEEELRNILEDEDEEEDGEGEGKKENGHGHHHHHGHGHGHHHKH